MDKVRLAVIGIGNIGNLHLGNIENQPKVQLTAVCDIVPEKADAAAAKYGVKAYYDSDALLADKVCDAIIIGTPHYFHTTIGIAALDAGHHVLVEKPISVHKADCERLIAAHKRNSQMVFAAMFNQRTDPFYQKIREMVQSGELGDLLRVNWIITNWFRTQSYYDSGGWRATWGGEGGGVLLNQCPHNLDLLQWITGMPEKVHGFCDIGKRHTIEVEDEVTAFLEYPGGCTGLFVTSTGEAPGTNRLEIAADNGKLVYEGNQIVFTRNLVPAAEFLRTSEESFARPPYEVETFTFEHHGGQHMEILENFADAILTGAPLIAPAEEGIHSVELANAMLYSTFVGQPVEVPLDADAYEAKLQELIATSTFQKEVKESTAEDMGKSFSSRITNSDELNSTRNVGHPRNSSFVIHNGDAMQKTDIGIVGLGVMGRMLALNMARNGFRVAGYDLDADKVMALNTAGDGKAVGYQILGDFFGLLERPRKILMMVPAGKPVDAVIAGLRPALDRGDLLIDGGNSHFRDTERRLAMLEADGIRYIGTGVSGGEYGALWGPSIMPGGDPKAWSLIRPIFEAIAAKVPEPDGTLSPCVAYIGPQGAGHFVKMVHNGIEYGDMQLIAETYDVLHRGLGLSALQLHDIFARWNEGDLQSYLIEITRDIFATLDEETGEPLVDMILDEAQHKGTGKWTSQSALDLGAAAPMISAAVEARMLSAYKDERVRASKFLTGPTPAFEGDADVFVDTMERAMYAAKICLYAQGFGVLRAASEEYDYDLHHGEIAKIWRGGCIIRAQFLNKITTAFARDANLPNLLLDPDLGKAVEARQDALRQVICYATANGVPVPAFSSALAYFDAYRSARLPANLLQSQRDYFGAHTYRRIDRAGTFHTDWAKIGQKLEMRNEK